MAIEEDLMDTTLNINMKAMHAMQEVTEKYEKWIYITAKEIVKRKNRFTIQPEDIIEAAKRDYKYQQ
ncbi:MAG: histone-like protein [Candidatus Pacearchaeota archaeon]|jgi:histone H3/H4